jgi:hypothetical protein
MPGDPRVCLLADLRSAGVRQDAPADWDRLLRAVADLPGVLRAESMPDVPWDSLPAAARPSRAFYTEVMLQLRLRLQPPCPLRVRPSALPTLMPRAVPPAASASPPKTAHQRQFLKTVKTVPAAQALADFRAAQTSDKSKAASHAAAPLYEESCASQGLAPWPPTLESMELFAAFLRASTKQGPDAYRAPAGYWWAVLQEARSRGHYVSFDPRWADRVVAALERDMPEHEQALPLTVPLLRRIGAAVATEKDMLLLLSLIAAVFCVARADCFLHVRPSDIVDLDADRVQVTLYRLKGSRRIRANALVFRRLPSQPLGSHFGPLCTPSGNVVLCPVYVFRLLRQKAVDSRHTYLAQCGGYTTLLRRLQQLFERADVPMRQAGRARNLYSIHSTRVGAVCYLLRAGLSEQVIKALADWSSDQIRRYAHRVMFDPELVEPWAFYNPETGCYSDQPAYSRPPNLATSSAGPVTAPCPLPNPEPDPPLTPDLGEGDGGGALGGAPGRKRGRPRTRPPKVKKPRGRPPRVASLAGGAMGGPEADTGSGARRSRSKHRTIPLHSYVL